MQTVEGNGGFRIAITEGGCRLNDERICTALEAAVNDSGVIALWRTPEGFIRVVELHHDAELLHALDRRTATFGQGHSLVDALRWFLGHFWVRAEDQ